MVNTAEDHDASTLSPLAYPIILTPEAKIGFLKALGSLRQQNDYLMLSAIQLRQMIAELGETPTEAELKQMRATVPLLYRNKSADAPKQR